MEMSFNDMCWIGAFSIFTATAIWNLSLVRRNARLKRLLLITIVWSTVYLAGVVLSLSSEATASAEPASISVPLSPECENFLYEYNSFLLGFGQESYCSFIGENFEQCKKDYPPKTYAICIQESNNE